MDIRQMRYFMEICRLGSVSRAAEQLFVSQQGLSSSIRRLEQELGCALFYRKGNALILTDHGQYFLEHSLDIIDAFDTLQNHFADIGREKSAKVSVLCAYSILSKGPLSLPSALLADDTGIDITIGECYTTECQKYMEDNSYHFAICYEQDWVKDYHADYLFEVEHCFVVHKSHPLATESSISLSQLDGQRVIFPKRKTAVWSVFNDLLSKHDVHPINVFETNQALEISSILQQNHEMAGRMTYRDAVTLNNPELKIIRLKDVPFTTSAVLVHRQDVTLTEAEKTFRKIVLENCQDA